MIGSAFNFADPIFPGLAISLVYGLAFVTALTLLVTPPVYVVPRDDEATPKAMPRNNCFKLRLASNAGRWCNSILDGRRRR
ncbi:MAG: hypothetical protein ABSD90_13080 [Methylocystis sp.]|jgi:hypothetical protein